jgi:hypothetical protein
VNAPAVDRHPLKESNAGVRIPGGAVDDLRVVAEGLRRGDDDEVLIVVASYLTVLASAIGPAIRTGLRAAQRL